MVAAILLVICSPGGVRFSTATAQGHEYEAMDTPNATANAALMVLPQCPRRAKPEPALADELCRQDGSSERWVHPQGLG